MCIYICKCIYTNICLTFICMNGAIYCRCMCKHNHAYPTSVHMQFKWCRGEMVCVYIYMSMSVSVNTVMYIYIYRYKWHKWKYFLHTYMNVWSTLWPLHTDSYVSKIRTNVIQRVSRWHGVKIKIYIYNTCMFLGKHIWVMYEGSTLCSLHVHT